MGYKTKTKNKVGGVKESELPSMLASLTQREEALAQDIVKFKTAQCCGHTQTFNFPVRLKNETSRQRTKRGSPRPPSGSHLQALGQRGLVHPLFEKEATEGFRYP